MAQAELIAAVKAHAVAHYETGGWDFVVECWDDSEIAEVLDAAGAATEAEAIAAVARDAGLMDEQRRAVRAEIF